MVENTQVARDHLVLEHRTRRNIDARAVVGDDDDSALQRDLLSDRDITRNRQVVELQEVGDALEAIRVIIDLQGKKKRKVGARDTE